MISSPKNPGFHRSDALLRGIWVGLFRSIVQERNELRVIDRDLTKILETKVIGGLDALRALAITLVLVDHFRITDYFLGVHPQLGSLGVMIFFVLSGFLITRILLSEYRRTGGIDLANFYRRRAYRIFPAFYCCWILTAIVECLAHQFHWKTAVVSFFYLMDYGRALAPESLQPFLNMWISWSLAVEEKFYLLWPVLLLFLIKRPGVIRVLSSVILGQWVYRFILCLVFNVRWSYFYHAFDMRVDALLVGCLLAILVQNNRTKLLCCELLRWRWLSPLAPLALIIMVVFPPADRAAALLGWSLQPVIIGVMLLQFVFWGAKFHSVIGGSIIRATAHLSYSLYLYHPLAGKITYLLHAHHLGFYTVALTLLLSTGSFYLIEKPFMRLRDRRMTYSQPGASP